MVNILLIFSKTVIHVWICWLQMGKTNDEVVTMTWAHTLLVLGKATRFLGSTIPFEAMVLRLNRLRMRLMISGFLIWNYVFDIKSPWKSFESEPLSLLGNFGSICTI